MTRQTGRMTRNFGPQSSKPKQLKTWLVAGLAALLLAVAVALLFWTKTTRIEIDVATLCPVVGPVAVHAVLLDQSDPITPLQAQRLGQVVDRLVEEAAIGERIDLYVLARDGTAALTPRLSLCRPKSEGNKLTENPKRIHDHYIARFRQPLDAALKALVAPSVSQTSPLMESVKAVCVAAFGMLPHDAAARMTIASDMIQYSRILNHYKQRDFEAFSKTPGYNEVLSDCHRAKVDVLYLVRPKDVQVQDRRHQLFWERFFDRENAVLNRMEAI